jgi:hypothetical protein
MNTEERKTKRKEERGIVRKVKEREEKFRRKRAQNGSELLIY